MGYNREFGLAYHSSAAGGVGFHTLAEDLVCPGLWGARLGENRGAKRKTGNAAVSETAGFPTRWTRGLSRCGRHALGNEECSSTEIQGLVPTLEKEGAKECQARRRDLLCYSMLPILPFTEL